jgi:Circularly permutated YpsA SLOG family/Domain of unknown function (DUF6794)
MIKKIISGGQTGADRATLDVAIEFGIPYGGWIPKGRKTENGTLPAKYILQEMPTGSYPKRTEQNILDSDGTLIMSHGKLTGGSSLTKKLADRHGRACLHIDLNKINAFEGATEIHQWLQKYGIEILNVAGPRASKDPRIYEDTESILKMVLHLGVAEEGTVQPPGTVDEGIEPLIPELSLKDRTLIASMEESDLIKLHFSLGLSIRNELGLWAGNDDLMRSCCSVAGAGELDLDDASAVIVRKLWQKLKGRPCIEGD